MPLDFRDAAFNGVYEIIAQDKDAMLLYNDMGAIGLDRIRADYPKQVINMGIAEQNMMSVASGLALAGKVVFTYGIIPHVTGRCYEQIKLDICSMNLPVINLGIGSGLSYGVDGPTHHATQDLAIMRALPGMTIYNPADAVTASACIRMAYQNRTPAYLRMDKDQHQAIYSPEHNFNNGISTLLPGNRITLIATGIMTHQALAAAKELVKDGIMVKLVDLFRIKPVNRDGLVQIIEDSKIIVTIEEHIFYGGIGSLISELAVESGSKTIIKYLCLGEGTYLGSTSRKWAHERYGLSTSAICQTIIETCKERV